MLELLCYKEKYDDNVKLERQELQTCLFDSEYFILDNEKDILYYCSYIDMKNLFLDKCINVKGIETKDNRYIILDLIENNEIKFNVDSVCVNIFIEKPIRIVRTTNARKIVYLYYKDSIFVLENETKKLQLKFTENTTLDYYDLLDLMKRKSKCIKELYTKNYLDNKIYARGYNNNVNELIETYKELYKKGNTITTFDKLFYMRDKVEILDLQSLPCDNIIDCSEMFRGCRELKTVKFFSLEINNPIKFTRMFYECRNLETVDFTNLKGDFYSCDNKEDEKLLCSLLYLGLPLKNKNYCIFVLSKNTPNFNKYIIERNKLKFLGNVTDEYEERLNIFRAKLAFKGIPIEESYFYVIK